MTNTIDERTEKDKAVVIEALKEVPIVQVACKKAGIGRATYYRWRKEDLEFLKNSESAMAQGFDYVCDLSESQLLTLIREKKMPAIMAWLRHHHPRYGAKVVASASRFETASHPKYGEFKEVAAKYEDELRSKIVSTIHDTTP